MSNDKNIIPIDATTGLPAEIPEFMQADGDMGLTDVGQYLRPNALKIKQKMSGGELEDQPNGSLWFSPDMTKAADKGEPIYFVPIYHLVEYLRTNPIGAEVFVAERTTDHNSELARKCLNREFWRMPDGTRHSESHNFVVAPFGPSAELNDGEPFLLRFWRGGYRDGMKLLRLLKKRKKGSPQGVPIFGCVFELRSADRESAEGPYVGLDIDNPSADSGVSAVVTDADFYAVLKALHQKAQESELDVDYERPESETVNEEASPF